jgi:hypothetical protein
MVLSPIFGILDILLFETLTEHSAVLGVGNALSTTCAHAHVHVCACACGSWCTRFLLPYILVMVGQLVVLYRFKSYGVL